MQSWRQTQNELIRREPTGSPWLCSSGQQDGILFAKRHSNESGFAKPLDQAAWRPVGTGRLFPLPEPLHPRRQSGIFSPASAMSISANGSEAAAWHSDATLSWHLSCVASVSFFPDKQNAAQQSSEPPTIEVETKTAFVRKTGDEVYPASGELSSVRSQPSEDDSLRSIRNPRHAYSMPV